MPKPFPEEKRQEWKRLVEQWEKNDRNISITRWCSEQKINYNTFLYWRERFGSNPVKQIDRSSFKELPNPITAPGITLEYNRIRIQLERDFDVTTLTKCLRVLKEVV